MWATHTIAYILSGMVQPLNGLIAGTLELCVNTSPYIMGRLIAEIDVSIVHTKHINL